MEGSSSSFLSGVALAVAGFAIKEVASFQMKSFRLRKVLIADADATSAGLALNEKTLPDVETSLKSGNAASFIWEAPGSGAEPPFLADAPIYLTPVETAMALNFYAAQGRMDAIRDEFNGAIRNLLTDSSKRTEFTDIAIACVHDLQRNSEEARKIGKELSAELKKRMWDDGADGADG